MRGAFVYMVWFVVDVFWMFFGGLVLLVEGVVDGGWHEGAGECLPDFFSFPVEESCVGVHGELGAGVPCDGLEGLDGGAFVVGDRYGCVS